MLEVITASCLSSLTWFLTCCFFSSAVSDLTCFHHLSVRQPLCFKFTAFDFLSNSPTFCGKVFQCLFSPDVRKIQFGVKP